MQRDEHDACRLSEHTPSLIAFKEMAELHSCISGLFCLSLTSYLADLSVYCLITLVSQDWVQALPPPGSFSLPPPSPFSITPGQGSVLCCWVLRGEHPTWYSSHSAHSSSTCLLPCRTHHFSDSGTLTFFLSNAARCQEHSRCSINECLLAFSFNSLSKEKVV